MISHFKIYGERNSGTNYVQWLFETNFKLEYWRSGALGWKHGMAQLDEIRQGDYNHVLFLLVLKNPYSWLLSMHKNPHHATHLKRFPFNRFCLSPWQSYYSKPRAPIPGEGFDNIFKLRSAKVGSQLGVLDAASNALLINYEALLADTEGFVTSAAEQFKLPQSEQFFTSTSSYHMGQKRTYGKVFNRQAYYLDFEVEEAAGYQALQSL